MIDVARVLRVTKECGVQFEQNSLIVKPTSSFWLQKYPVSKVGVEYSADLTAEGPLGLSKHPKFTHRLILFILLDRKRSFWSNSLSRLTAIAKRLMNQKAFLTKKPPKGPLLKHVLPQDITPGVRKSKMKVKILNGPIKNSNFRPLPWLQGKLKMWNSYHITNTSRLILKTAPTTSHYRYHLPVLEVRACC